MRTFDYGLHFKIFPLKAEFITSDVVPDLFRPYQRFYEIEPAFTFNGRFMIPRNTAIDKYKICEHEIVLRVCKFKTKTISGSQLLQNTTCIIKQTVVLLWKNYRKYGSVMYSFNCTLNSSRPSFWYHLIQ